MNAKNTIAVVLIGMGVIVLAFSGISFTTPGETIKFLGLNIATTENHFIPPVSGALVLLAGIVLLLVNPKQVA